MGVPQKYPFNTTSKSYGTFSTPEDKYNKLGYKERIFKDFFKAYTTEEKVEKEKLDESIKNIRLYDTTNRNIHIQQPMDYNLGRRHMITQDGIEVPNDRMDKLFMAQHDMSKYPSIISNKQADNYIDKFVPYYKDKEVTYWSTNLEKGNMYKSHTLGVNPFARSNAFTEPLQQTKGASSFYGNTCNSKDAKNIHLNENDMEFMEKYYNSTQTV
jgi:hypothetical protein